jgi:small-conductance mechanosensitive channel
VIARRTHLIALALLLAVGLAASLAHGQPNANDASETAKAAPETPAQPEIIPVAEISSASRTTDERLRSIEAQLVPDAGVERIVKQRESYQSQLADANEDLNALLAASPSRSRLADAQGRWANRSDQLERWRKVLRKRASELDGGIEYLQEHTELWRRTRSNAVEAGAPDAVLDRIDSTLGRMQEITRDSRDRLASVLTIQDGLTQADEAVTQAIERIDAARRDFRGQLFTRDALPLWRWASDDIETQTHVQEARESIASDLTTLREYARQNVTSLLLALSVFVIFLYYAGTLRRGVRLSTERTPELESAAALFEYPASLALLATVTGFSLVTDQPPNVVKNVMLLILVVPLFRLLPPLVPVAFRPLLFATGIFFALSQLRTLIDQAPLAGRLFFLLELAAAFAFLLWIMRPRRLETLEPGQRIPALISPALRVALAVVGVAALAGVLGYRAFALLLGDGVLGIAYIGVLLFGALRSIDAVLRVSLNTERARSLGFVRRRSQLVIRWSMRVLTLATLLFWVDRALDLFAIHTPVMVFAESLLGASLSVGAIAISLGDVLAFAFTLLAAWIFSRVTRFFLEEEIFPKISLRRGMPNAISTLLHYSILSFGLMLALGAAGMDFSRVTLLAGAFGVGIGFGLQNVVNNFVSGLILLFERPIQTGDTVEVGGLLGDVRRIGIRSSTVRTVDGAEVLVPNANLVSDQVINWTLSDRRRRIDVDVGVAYGTDATRVLELLLDIARANATTLDTPEPQALFLGFGDSSLDFRLRVWIPRFEEGLSVKSELAVAIQAALDQAGIEVPFPQRDLHLRSIDPDATRSLSREPEERS